jgi:enolase
VIAAELGGHDASNQRISTRRMIALDGTPNKGKLGANAILAVSMAAAAPPRGRLETPLYRYLGGRASAHIARTHDERAERRGPCRQHRGLSGIHDHAGGRGALRPGAAHGCGDVPHAEEGAEKKGYNTSVGDEGGFAPSLKSNAEAIEVMLEAITKAGYSPGHDRSLSPSIPLPAKCTTGRKYVFFKSDKSKKTSEEMVKLYADWVRQYPSSILRTASRRTTGKAGHC